MSFKSAIKSAVFFFMFFAMAIWVSFMQPEVMAATGSWGDNVQEVTPNSQGVYEISNGAQLAWIAQQTNLSVADGGLDFSGKTVKLTSNIDLADHYWVPIGKERISSVRITFFNGTFDGAGKSITGLTINSTEDYQGLFGYVRYATIKNFTVSGTVTSTGNNTAGAIGYVDNSTIANVITDVNVTGGENTENTGGVAGGAEGSTIYYSENRGAITGNENVGGIVGYLITVDVVGAPHSILVGLFNSGDISGVIYTGGIAGYFYNAKLSTAYNHGNVSGESWTGGIGGVLFSSESYGIYNTGIVTNAPGDSAYIVGALSGQATSGSDISGGYYLSGNAFGNVSASISRTNVLSFNAQQELESAAIINGSSYTSLVEALNAQTGDYNQGNPTVKAPRWEVIDGEYPSFVVEDIAPISYWADNATEVVPIGDVYSISNASQLAWISLKAAGGETFEGKQIVLTGNINLEGHLWSPISPDYERGFMGTFDGKNHSITGLKIVSTARYQGLFGYIRQEGVVKNFSLSGSVYSSSATVGAVVGYNGGEIRNVKNSCSVSGSHATGGLVGSNAGSIYASFNTADVTGTLANIGGIAGINNGFISGVFSSGDVVGAEEVGALVGDNNGTVSAAFWLGTATVTGEGAGNGIGANTGTITNVTSFNMDGDLGVPTNVADETQTKVVKALNAAALDYNENINPSSLLYGFVHKTGQLPEFAIDDTASWPFSTTAITPNSQGVYLVTDASELAWVAQQVNSGAELFEGKEVKLAGDINLFPLRWVPIGGDVPANTNFNQFKGSFDGDGYTISSLYIDSSNIAQGLFGSIGSDAIVKNVSVDGSITGGQYTGSVVGYNYGVVVNVHSSAEVESTGADVGGIIGYSSAGLLANSYYSGDYVNGTENVGALVGRQNTGEVDTAFYYEETKVNGVNETGFGIGSANPTANNVSGFSSSGWVYAPIAVGASRYNSLYSALMARAASLNNDLSLNLKGWTNESLPRFTSEIPSRALWADNTSAVSENSQGEILIENGSQLAFVMVENNRGEYEIKDTVIRLVDDIDLSGYIWQPIGTGTNKFSGEFYGDGYKVIGINTDEYDSAQGLFGVVGVDGVIDGVTVEGSCNAISTVGSIAGSNYGLITNCTGLAAVNGETHVGGIVGSNLGTLTNSYSAGSVSGETNVGGVAGYSSKSLMNVYSVATVNHTGSSSADSVGQVVGDLEGSKEENNYILYLTSHEGPSAVGINEIGDDVVFGYANGDLLLTGLSHYIDPTGRAADWTVKSGGTPYLSFEDNGITGRMDLPGEAVVTITLKQGENTVYKTITRSTDFILGDVASGSYTLTISTDGALDTVIHNLEHSGGALDLKTHANSDIKLIKLFFGDLNKNGVIDGADIAIVASSENYNKQSSAADNALADVNRDGIINFIDLATLRNSALLGKTQIELDYK